MVPDESLGVSGRSWDSWADIWKGKLLEVANLNRPPPVYVLRRTVYYGLR
jgi:hypothetical protein